MCGEIISQRRYPSHILKNHNDAVHFIILTYYCIHLLTANGSFLQDSVPSLQIKDLSIGSHVINLYPHVQAFLIFLMMLTNVSYCLFLNSIACFNSTTCL